MLETENPRHCWSTPDNLWEALNDEFRFDIDVAASPENTRLHSWIGPEHPNRKDALNSTWKPEWTYGIGQGAFCNPPFKPMLPWIEKAHEEVLHRRTRAAVVIATCGPSTEWFHYADKYASEIRMLGARPAYGPAGVKESKNKYEGAIVVFRPTPKNWPGARIWLYDWQEK